MKPAVASLYQAVDLLQEIRPLLIGERSNTNGSKKFREALLADDFQACLAIGLEQEAAGAHLLDLCSAYAGRDELHDMLELVRLYAGAIKIPIMIDSTTPSVIEAALRIYPGRAIVNSINLEDGGVNIRKVCPLLKKYGAAVIALTINKNGMAMTAADKIATAREIHAIAVGEFGLRPQDLLFDALTFTIGAGDETLRDAAVQTLEGIRGIKAALPGVMTVLGLSNISFGLPPVSRKVLNSVFLHEAVAAGLDAAIVDAGKVLPLAQIPETDREICMDLLYDRVKDPNLKPLMRFIEHFKDKKEERAADTDDDHKIPSAQLYDLIVRGEKDGLEDILSIVVARKRPLAIINEILVPAMRHVGELFGRGELLLPFVLQSAEVMKRAVTFLEPLMDKADSGSMTKVLLATVQGDVHDIGKNLVDIILSNNGYKVYNIGIKAPAENIIAKAIEYNVDIIGLSGLLVKSAIVMQETMPQYEAAGFKTPILLGGAALTPKFVAESCVPGYRGGPVVYCADAFAGLRAVREFEEGKLKSTTYSRAVDGEAMKPGLKNVDVARNLPTPQPPFIGRRLVRDLDPAILFDYINDQALFRGRWGYRRAKMSKEAYDELIATKVQPLYADFKRRAVQERLVQPRVVYGYFRCYSEDNALYVEHAGETHTFAFPRQAEPPHFCIADFYKTRAEGGDIVGFFVVTIGEEISKATHALFDADNYHDYLMLHGFSVEITDALAEYWHQIMRRELGIAGSEPKTLTGFVTQEYQGSRYGFGYPSCPDLNAHIPVFKLLTPGDIGVTLTESMEMVPEESTSAIISHHPQAKYFAV